MIGLLAQRTALSLCLLSAFLAGGCTATDPLDDVSLAAPADRPALQKCLTAADLVGNQWPSRAGKARCWLSLPQEPSLAEIAQTLKAAGGGNALDQRYAQILARHSSDPAHRDLLFAAYQSFQTPTGRKLAAAWLQQSPHSPYAKLAQGEALIADAWSARGSDFAQDTTPAQFQGMATHLRAAEPLLESALQSEPRLTPACVDLMEIGNMTSDDSVRLPATRACLTTDPLSWHVNNQLLRDLDPRWGGSFEALDRAIAQIKTHVAQSPMLASLLAKGIGRRAYLDYGSTDLRPIAPALDQAARIAPDAFYLAKAGMAAQQAGDRKKALDYLTQALRFEPRDADFLMDRAEILKSMGRVTQALFDIRKVSARPPDECGCENIYPRLARFFGEQGMVADERDILQKDLRFPHDHQWALTVLCQTYMRGATESAQAVACTRQLVAEYPGDAEGAYLRTLASYSAKDPDAATFDARFRKLADASDPVRQQELKQLDELRSNPSH